MVQVCQGVSNYDEGCASPVLPCQCVLDFDSRGIFFILIKNTAFIENPCHVCVAARFFT
jgi:hypothetical protein